MANPTKINLRVLLMALVLLVCGTMALGGTFATSLNLAGTETTLPPNSPSYNIDVKYHANGSYSTSLLSNGAIFTKDVPWCPGYTKIVYLEVTNNEAFPVKCSLNMNVKTTGFGNSLKYAVIPLNLKAADVDHPDNWEDFENQANGSTVLKQDYNYIFNDLYLSFPTTENANDNTKHFALAIHMDEETPNHYQGKKLEMNFEFRVNTNWTPDAHPAFTPAPNK